MQKIYKEYTSFYSLDFNAKIFLECDEKNFKKTAHIQSIKFFEQSDLSTQPIITIAIPAYKRIDTLKPAIDSAIFQMTAKKTRGGGGKNERY